LAGAGVTQLPGRVDGELERQLAELRRPLLGFCYRMLGSAHEAEDAVQETMMRAWRGLGRLDDRAGLRPWVYRIATNVCIDATNQRRRRAMPMDLAAASDGRGELGSPLPESAWVSPIPTWRVDPDDPVERAVSRESIRLAFVAALQHLLPRQRAVLILRDVLRWKAAEVATLLETSVDAVNSTLRRARSAMAHARSADVTPAAGSEPVDAQLLRRYVEAFERFDIDGIVALLHRDAVVSMPPYSFWLRGRDAFKTWLESNIVACGHARPLLTEANGVPALGIYKPGPGGVLVPAGLHALTWRRGKVVAWHAFLDPALFGMFGLPEALHYLEEPAPTTSTPHDERARHLDLVD
jgi:RNA polymerase sigma-70 factor, ECF subfamily